MKTPPASPGPPSAPEAASGVLITGVVIDQDGVALADVRAVSCLSGGVVPSSSYGTEWR